MVIKNKNNTDYRKAFTIASDLLGDFEILYSFSTPINKIIFEYDIELCPFSEIRKKLKSDSPVFKNAGFLSSYNGNYIICYDDNSGIQRIRWTLAHELGHYFFNHSFNNNEEYQKQEAEANYFASQLLMPLELMLLLDNYYYLCESLLGLVCNTNPEACRYRMNYYKNYKHTFANLNLNSELMERYDYLIRTKLLNDTKFNSLKRHHY